MRDLPHVLTTTQLHEVLTENGGKIDRTTIWRLATTDLRWSACVLRRTKRSTQWSVQRLQAAGILKESRR